MRSVQVEASLSVADVLRLPGRRIDVTLDPLIKEARDRQRRRRRRFFLLAALAVGVAIAENIGFRPGGGSGPPSGPAAAQPAQIPHQAGWYVGSSRVETTGCSRCVQTATWASTVPYLDKSGDFPQRTIV